MQSIFSTENVNANCHLDNACIATNVNKTLKKVSTQIKLNLFYFGSLISVIMHSNVIFQK
jgi:hypothetical protein